ncbi:spore germination protein GerPC [Thalassorhabdus alkalitolerans]|uniref:Spore germination protein GerPC n=1 Tax=Thalassorhabdus alkalitolerans TaxID=2282697 RepID=A0ABW0YV24_9BACI|nr:spore germination protein GerPC [Thalassobacillus sp. C254]
MYIDLYSWAQHMEKRIKKLEEENEELRKQIEAMNKTTIENVNYKIQELHVKELKGTLNIGWAGKASPEEVEDLLQDITIDSENKDDN